MYELLPCPFCGSNDLEVVRSTKAFVRCKKCSTDGPKFGDGMYAEYIHEQWAVAKWNKRYDFELDE